MANIWPFSKRSRCWINLYIWRAGFSKISQYFFPQVTHPSTSSIRLVNPKWSLDLKVSKSPKSRPFGKARSCNVVIRKLDEVPESGIPVQLVATGLVSSLKTEQRQQKASARLVQLLSWTAPYNSVIKSTKTMAIDGQRQDVLY